MIGVRLEMRHAVLDGPLHHWIVVATERNRRVIALDEELMDADVLTERARRRFQAARHPVHPRGFLAFVVQTVHGKRHDHVAALRHQRMLVKDAADVDHCVQRAGLPVALHDLAGSNHGGHSPD